MSVVKFNPIKISDTFEVPSDICNLSYCRHKLWESGLIGCNPEKYGGLVYGNVSMKNFQYGNCGIVVSGSQISQPHIRHNQYCYISRIIGNNVYYSGTVIPSSESMSHWALQSSNVHFQYVLHVHSNSIWKNAEKFGLISISAKYGSLELCANLSNLIYTCDLITIALTDHEDGIFIAGIDLNQMVEKLLQLQKICI